jgi:hypothetical protein
MGTPARPERASYNAHHMMAELLPPGDLARLERALRGISVGRSQRNCSGCGCFLRVDATTRLCERCTVKAARVDSTPES